VAEEPDAEPVSADVPAAGGDEAAGEDDAAGEQPVEATASAEGDDS
jgi:hypothetical protein